MSFSLPDPHAGVWPSTGSTGREIPEDMFLCNYPPAPVVDSGHAKSLAKDIKRLVCEAHVSINLFFALAFAAMIFAETSLEASLGALPFSEFHHPHLNSSEN